MRHAFLMAAFSPKEPRPVARRIITEAEWERLADLRVFEALRRDPRYQHAENAEDQALAEEEISAEVEQAMHRDYRLSE